MGRVRLQIKKIENKTYRQITYSKRKCGLLKKAFEISTLCDVEVALIIFSQAGKLILFQGKKRLDEILTHFIDLPPHQRRPPLRDLELVRRMVTQMSLEAELFHHIALNKSNNSVSSRDMTMSIDSQLEEIEKEISRFSAELEDVEKQLQYFIKSASSIKSVNEAEFLEGILEQTLKNVSIRKQELEANSNFQLTIPEKGQIHPQSADESHLIVGSSNYCLADWPSQYEFDARILPANHFPVSAHSQFLRTESSLPLVEGLPCSLPNLCGAGAYQNPTGIASAASMNSSTSRPQHNDGIGCFSQVPYDKFFNNNSHFSPGMMTMMMSNIQQGGRPRNNDADDEQNKSVDAALYRRDCGLPFP